MFICLLLTCVFLLGVVVLKLASRAREQQRVFDELEEALERSRAEAEEQKTRLAERADLDQMKNEFISTVSHELRTPLTSIRGALGLLSSGLLGNVDGKAQSLLRIASTNSERLIRLINDILDLERMESGLAPVTLLRCSIYDLAREAVDAMNAMADTGQIRLALKCYAAPEAIYFDADPDRMLQVLTNLLSNAIKFSPPETTVTIEIDADEELLTLKVVDRGRGIPDDKLECIFDRFQQVENADASKKGGTGLGLAICRSIVQQHGGMIWAQSNKSGAVSHKTAMQTSQNGSSANHNGVHPSGNGAASGRTETRETFGGAGTTFCLQFKRCPRTGDTALPTGVTSLIDRGVGLILVCDDDAGVRTVVSEQLRQQGYDVIEAGSGEEVIALTQEQATQNTALPEISAVLLDLHLPGISGWETLRQMKSTVGTASIPTIILSVVPPTQRLLQTGYASGWVQKPFNSNLLLAELAKVLQSESHAAAGGEAKSVAMPVV